MTNEETTAAPVIEGNEKVLLERRGQWWRSSRSTAPRPATVNGDVAQGVEAAIDLLESDDDLWVGVLTGAAPKRAGSFRPVPT